MNSRGILRNPLVFTILPRNASGTHGQPYEASEPIVAHVTEAMSICRVMLLHPRVLEALDKIASRYFYQKGTPWCVLGANGKTTDKITYNFISKIIHAFPLVFIDYTLKNQDSNGFHTRRSWDGDFELRHQSISINGKVDEHKFTF